MLDEYKLQEERRSFHEIIHNELILKLNMINHIKKEKRRKLGYLTYQNLIKEFRLKKTKIRWLKLGDTEFS